MKTLKNKVILNFSSTVLPMSIGLLAIPIMIEGMGLERFGMLSIAWMLVGYFGILDMGLGRALTHKIAQRLGGGNTRNLKPLILKTLGIVGLLGLLGSLGLGLAADWLVYGLFNISGEYQKETLHGLYWLALTIPFVIVSTGMLGVLEGQQYFGWTAIIRTPLGILMFLAPLVVLNWTDSLEWILASLFVVRLIIWLALTGVTIYTLREYPGWDIEIGELKSLFTFGGWLTVSNVVSPMMVYFDRFYIASVLSVSVVAFYTTPFDLVIKALIIPFALVGVMFASFATEWRQNKIKVIKQFKFSILAVMLVMVPFTLITFVFAKPGMTLWLGESFALQSYEIVQWLSVGILLNALAMIPFALIQAIGRADITAKLHLAELPFYALLLWFFVDYFGLVGAAYAWVVRVLIDCIFLYVVAKILIKKGS